MDRVKLVPDFEFSRIALGFWRLVDWGMRPDELESFVQQTLDLGITTFDHADIYGDYQCEALFGKVIKNNPSLRDRIELVTKCGIKLVSPKFPGQTINHYDTSYRHIISSVEASLVNLQTDRIDVLLIHRPDPLMDPAEIARAFYHLKSAGKVRYFGVSNFTPLQFDALNKHFGGQLVTNQIEVSPYCLEHFDNGNFDYLLKKRIAPMGWSPLAGGELLTPSTEKGLRIHKQLLEITEETGAEGIDQVIYAWILKHPSNVVPITGSGKIERLNRAADALKLNLSREQWYRIYNASRGHPLP